MKAESKFSIKKRTVSFNYAFNGFRVLFREEHNSWIHLTIAVITLGAAFLLDISRTEWIEIVLVIGFVFAMEIINSAVENLSDFVSPEKHDAIKKIKDLSAAAVLISALAAIAVGAIIFLPKIL